MTIDVKPLLRGEVKSIKLDYTLPVELEGIKFLEDARVVGEIIDRAGYMRLSLKLTVPYVAECARCLAPVSDSFSLSLEKTVATKEVLADVDEDRLDDYAIIENGFLDMDEQLMEQLEMEFPVRILCSEDCRGLCQRCGKNLNEGECECDGKEIDPRLEPLRKILEEMKKSEK